MLRKDSGLKFKKIIKELAQPIQDTLSVPSEFNAVLDAHGSYNTMQFVLRLSPRVHELVEALTTGNTHEHDYDELISAYSTYLHETIHWWQHVGSTSGLILSLCYPAQTHSNMDRLKEFVALVGPKKPLKYWAENELRSNPNSTDETLVLANVAVNNTLDTEFYKILAVSPLRAEKLYEDNYFESVGHTYVINYGNTLHAIVGSCDLSPENFPDPQDWVESLEKLNAEQYEGFYYGSPIRRARVGLQAIFEGQACFNQLQFLQSMGGEEHCSYYKEQGYLWGVYISAFNEFLRITGLDWPDKINDPLVGLFLLICDLSINPTRGFPLPMNPLEYMIIDIDPGARFTKLSYAVKELPHLTQTIKNRSYKEYIQISGELTRQCGYDHPLDSLKKLIDICENDYGAINLMRELENFDFQEVNLPIRVMVAHFLAFSRDKYKHPEFFCWPGAYVSGQQSNDVYRELFLNHLSIFSDRTDSERIHPREMPGKQKQSLLKTINIFYGYILLYDLTRQWILDAGNFKYDYRWLTGREDNDELINWAKKTFEANYGVNPDDFEIVPLQTELQK